MNELYSISLQDSSPGWIRGMVEFNPGHPVFKGHFPGQPVVPGVWLVHAVKEVLGVHLGRSLALSEALNVKFLQVIDPGPNPMVTVEINYMTAEDGRIRIDAICRAGDIVFMKFKGIVI